MIVFPRVDGGLLKQIEEYFSIADACMEQFYLDISRHITAGLRPEPAGRGRTHILESRADDKRRHIEMILCGKALLPGYRDDIMVFLETFDRVPNAAESVLAVVETERIDIPESFNGDFLDLVECNVEAYRLLRRCGHALFSRPSDVVSMIRKVDLMESESDRIERRLIYGVFDSDIDRIDKLQLRNVAVGIGCISDRAEDVADRLGLIAMKHPARQKAPLNSPS